MIKMRVTHIFVIIFTITFLTSFILGIAWLFDAYPNNLLKVWKVLIKCLIVSFFFQLLFGAKITFK